MQRFIDAFGAKRPWIMGVLNITPDSFSDGGLYLEPGAAAEQGRRLAREGAVIIDIGGESTAPGAPRVSAAEELRRIAGPVAGLAADGPTRVRGAALCSFET